MAAGTKSRKQPPRPAPPEVEDHGAFQRRFWAAQRIAWVVFSLILIACLLGLLGRGGMFATSTIASSGGSIDIPTISRWNAPDEMRVALAPDDKDQILFVDGRFLEAFSIEGVDPPQRARSRRMEGSATSSFPILRPRLR